MASICWSGDESDRSVWLRDDRAMALDAEKCRMVRRPRRRENGMLEDKEGERGLAGRSEDRIADRPESRPEGMQEDTYATYEDRPEKAGRLRAVMGCLFWVVLGLCMLAGMRKVGLGPKKTVAAGLVVAAAVGIHSRRMQKTPGYIWKILGIEAKAERKGRSGKKRIYEYDWLRTMAVVMVIVTHAVQMDIASEMVPEGAASYWMTVLYVFCLSCNLLYVMLSGALLMPYKEEKLSDFYLHRLAKVALPMLVYFVFYLWINGELEQIGPHTPGWILSRFFCGDTPGSPHYWLMYVILGLYVVVPFFRYMLKSMPYKALTAMVFLSGIGMYLKTYSPIPCAVDPLLSSWIGVAVTGFWVTRKETRRYDKPIMALGLTGLLITMYCIKTRDDFLIVCCNCSPTMLMISAGLFSLVFSVPKIFSKGNVVLSVLGKYSFSLILIHWIVLYFATRVVFQIYTSQYLYVGGILLALSVTLLASLAAAFLIDNLVVVVAETGYEMMVDGVRRLAESVRGRGGK